MTTKKLTQHLSRVKFKSFSERSLGQKRNKAVVILSSNKFIHP